MTEIRDPLQEEPARQDKGTKYQPNADVDEYAPKRRFMHYREEVWLYWVRVIFLFASAIGTFAVVGVYMWHLVGPQSCRWLCDTDIVKLKDLAITIIVGLIMSATTTYFFKKNMK